MKRHPAIFLFAALLPTLTPAPVQAQVYQWDNFTGRPGSSGSANGNAANGNARFNRPIGVAMDGSGNLYIADTGNHTIRKVTPAGVVTTLAGSAGNAGTANGTGTAARFNSPRGVAVDGSGNVYVADYGNHAIRRVTPAGAVTTLAGTAGSAGNTNGTGAAARFRQPYDVAIAGSNLYVADFGNHTIRRVTTAGVVTTLAGSAGNAGSANGTGAAARFRNPIGLAIAGSNLYAVDFGNHTIRRVTTGAGAVTTLAGSAGNTGSEDGAGANARFRQPAGLAISGANLYVVDFGNHTIRKVTTAGVVTTIGGSALNPGSADGAGSAARFRNPIGIAVGSDGSLFVTDYDNHRISRGVANILDRTPSFTPSVVLSSDRHFDRVNKSCFREQDWDDNDRPYYYTYCEYEQQTLNGVTFKIVADITGVNLDAIDENTSFAVVFGGLSFSGKLGDAAKYKKGNKSVFFPAYTYDVERGENIITKNSKGGLTLKWTATRLTISFSATADEGLVGSVTAAGFAGQTTEEGKKLALRSSLPLTVAFAGFNGSRTCYIKGTSAVSYKRFGRGEDAEDYELNHVSLNGAADYTPPKITLTSPKQGSAISGEPVVLSGKVTDGHRLSSRQSWRPFHLALLAGAGEWPRHFQHLRERLRHQIDCGDRKRGECPQHSYFQR